MKFVHTYWSKPSQNNRWGIKREIAERCNLVYYALSLAYLKKLNQKVVLYTDDWGKMLLGDLPYDEVYTNLNDITYNYSIGCWAQGKMFALGLSELGDVFIDGDVFIKTQKCLDEIADGLNYDGMFQGLEYSAEFYGTRTNEELDEKLRLNRLHIYYDHAIHLQGYEYPHNITKFGQYAYNAGILLINNQEYKNKFLNAYKFLYDQIDKDVHMQNIYTFDNEFCPDLICEQRFLYECGKGYNIKTLLNYQHKDENGEQTINQQANSLGYQHVIGHYKYNQMDICKTTLKNLNYDLYLLCEWKEKNLLAYK